MLSVLLAKLIATALVVVGVSISVGKLGPRLGGILAGTPIVLGPGYFFMLQERPADFIEVAALSTLHALVATLLFSLCFVATAQRMGALASLGLATLCWIPAALLFTLLPGGVWLALLLYAGVLLVAEVAKRALRLNQPVITATSGWLDLVLRGLLAGVLVSVATTLAARSGPLLSGMLVGFPVGLFTIGWTLHQRYGHDVARATVGAMSVRLHFCRNTGSRSSPIEKMSVQICSIITTVERFTIARNRRHSTMPSGYAIFTAARSKCFAT